ncbi:MAG: hypothetical protein AAGE85_09010 [Pseudomonadota bacterium]
MQAGTRKLDDLTGDVCSQCPGGTIKTRTYDTSGNATQISKTDGVSTRGWTMTYDTYGRVLTVDGPRTDVSDVTTFEYHACTTSTRCGQLKKVTNALGHVTANINYNTFSLVSSVQDESRGAIEYQYNSGNLARQIGVRASSGGSRRWTYFTYTDADQVETVTTPDGLVLTYTYDDAHYLTKVADSFGDRIEYSHDSMGNVSAENTYDPGGVLERSMDYVYDLNNCLSIATAANAFNTSYLFDDVGNLETLTDASLAVTQNAYDSLNRLSQTTDALLGLTTYGYDDHDNLTSVAAANNAVTTYEYGAFDDLTKETSPDRGTTTYTHDAAGNVLTKTDARGRVTTYSYDALNRVTQIELDNLDTIDFQYDAGYYLKGKLTRITDPSGVTEWSYNSFGEVASKTQTIGSVVLTTSYGYDSAGRLKTVTLPSGKVATYTYSVNRATGGERRFNNGTLRCYL